MIWLVGTAEASVGEGYAAWAEGDVEAAITAWQRDDAPSGVRAYDLGTALLTAGRPVEALPPLLLAARVRPRDGDVFHNLSLARAAVVVAAGEAVTVPPPPPLEPAIARVITSGELGALSLGASAAASVVTALRRHVGGAVVAAALLLAVLLAAGTAYAWREVQAHPAAVLQVAAPVRAAPDPLSPGERELPPGTEVRWLRGWGSFVLVEDGKGRQGWVARDALLRAW